MLTHPRIADTRWGALCTWEHVGGLPYLVRPPRRDRSAIEDGGMNDTGQGGGEEGAGCALASSLRTASTVGRELSTRTRNGEEPDGQLRNGCTKGRRARLGGNRRGIFPPRRKLRERERERRNIVLTCSLT